MIPCLYDVSETAYTTNGIGKLADCISCYVTEKRNSSYELKMEYPADGIHADELTEGNIILAKPADNKSSQPFRIYKITTPLDGKLEVAARHISYQMNFITVSPVSVAADTDDQVAAAYEALLDSASTDCPFSFETDIESNAAFSMTEPVSFRSALGGADGSLLDTYGGEFEWDFYTVRLWKSRGADNGVRIVYGKNLVDFKMEKSIEDMVTGVHPYWKDSESGTIMELSEKIVTLDSSSLPFEKITTLDCSEQFEEQPTEASLRSYAQSYLNSTSTTEPDLDIDIEFAQLWEMPGYEDIAEAERVSLCDTVHVYITRLGIETVAKVTETEYDCLLERYKSVTLSNSVTSSRNSSLTSTLITSSQASSLVSSSVSKATSEVVSLIEATEESITLSYVKTLTETLEDYSTTTEVESMIQASEDGITISYSKVLEETLEDYSTTTEVKSLIEASEEGITLSYTKALEKTMEDYSTTTEVQSLIEASEEGIILSYTKTLTETLEDYSTTEEVKSLIEAGEEGILLEVSNTYVTSDEVSSIASANLVLTVKNGIGVLSGNADRIQLSSGELVITSGQLILATDGSATFGGRVETSSLGVASTGEANFYCDVSMTGTWLWADSVTAYFSGVKTTSSIDCGGSFGCDGGAEFGSWVTIDGTVTTGALYAYGTTEIHANAGVFGSLSVSSYVEAAAFSEISDERVKTDWKSLSAYDGFFNCLEPRGFHYTYDERKYHLGMGAQSVLKALLANGLTEDDFAGLLLHEKESDSPNYHGLEKEYGLNYLEFIPLLIYEVQNLKTENQELKTEMEFLRMALSD
ncbi:MAG: phage tail protein [Lachnospiraceae bacterium]|nr:phage tail protein [Lachnospiraceae bacterium]